MNVNLETFVNPTPVSQVSQTPATPSPAVATTNPQTATSTAVSPEQMLQAMQQMLQSATATPNAASPNPQTTITPKPEDLLAQQFEDLMKKFGDLFTKTFDGTLSNAINNLAQQAINEVNKNKELLVKENVVGKFADLLGETQKLVAANKTNIEEMLARFIQVAKEGLAQSPFMHMLRMGLAADPYSAQAIPNANNTSTTATA